MQRTQREQQQSGNRGHSSPGQRRESEERHSGNVSRSSLIITSRGRRFSSCSLFLCVLCACLGVLDASQTPQPFPQPASPTRPAQPTRPAPAAPAAPTKPAPAAGVAARPEAAPTEATLGVPIYPGAQFIASYDAGRGQRYYIFGSAGSFVELVTYYRTILKQKGELVYEVPATHEFDVGKYREETMAFPPGVTIKDFQSDVSQGYPNPKPGGQPARFPTIIQIVPVTERP
jgi:hypothetical protein